MEAIIPLYKPQGLTPLQAIQAFKTKHPQYQNTTISSAGRLDPMAEGLLLLLVNEENKKRKIYEALTKTYQTSIILGISTDTYDSLGKITHDNLLSQKTEKKEQLKSIIFSISTLKRILAKLQGTHVQPYPPYSSKPVNKKPLFYWARENKLDQITIPTKEITIFSIELVAIKEIKKENLQKKIIKNIENVTGNFRQEEILQTWQDFFQNTQVETFPVISLNITASSGTYIRSIANTIGKKIQTNAFAMSIKRTSIGTYTLKDAKRLQIKEDIISLE